MRWVTPLAVVVGIVLLAGCASAPGTLPSEPSPGSPNSSSAAHGAPAATPTASPTTAAAPAATPAAPAAVAAAAPSPGLAPSQAPAASRTVTAPPSPVPPAATSAASAGATAPGPTATGSRSAAQAPLSLEVTRPGEDLTEVPEGTASVSVVGRSLPSATVSVNGRLVELDASGAFRADVPLEDDITLIEVVASDASGAEVRAQRVVVRD